MSDNLLILHPINPFAAPNNIADFIASLKEIGLVGETFDFFDDTHFRPGKRFYELIQFRLEYTAIVIEDVDGELVEVGREPNRLLCHINITVPSTEPEFLGSGLTELPRCRNCDQSAAMDIVGDWYTNKIGYRWSCPKCGNISLIYDLDWEQKAGFFRHSIEIWGIHWQEAVPTNELLESLYGITGEKWAYIYSHI